ncbi:MAG TPA: protein translocase subunit SecF [Ktedonobacterales bacterium]|nr:protein translocase subunit SecF [Ktedonobacterales bacterium]
MFHLTRYKYWFFGISLLVILPGLIALFAWGLNLGIDYTGGSVIDLRFANSGVTTAQIQQVFLHGAHAQDVTVYSSTDSKAVVGGVKPTPAEQYAFIQFSRPIGPNEVTSVQGLLAKIDPANTVTVDHVYQTVTVSGQPDTALMVAHFKDPVTLSAVQAALQTLPPTDAPSVASANGSPTATPAATATAAPTATASAKATATATATAAAGSSTGTTTTTPTFPVTATNVSLGANPHTFEVNTQTSIQGPALDKIVFSMFKDYGPVFVQQKSEVGASIASQTTQKAILAVALASAAILLYIAIAFHKVGSFRRSLRFGASAIIALLHDALVVLGLWAIFGHFFHYKVDTLFLTAILTVIGFSVHDTIVVFDRLRENLARRTSESFETVADTSLVQTMSRSLNTSLTVLFTLSALTLFGGESIRQFTLALLIGIASGTYSSIFNASMILTVWETQEYKRWFGRGRKQSARTVASATRSREVAGTRA